MVPRLLPGNDTRRQAADGGWRGDLESGAARRQEGWNLAFDPSYAQRFVWGTMPNAGHPFTNADILIADEDNAKFDKGELVFVARRESDESQPHKLRLGTTYIGRHFLRSGANPEQIYRLRRKPKGQPSAARHEPEFVCVKFRRIQDELDSRGFTEKLEFDIVDSDDPDVALLDLADIELDLCTLAEHEQVHWLDHGRFSIE